MKTNDFYLRLWPHASSSSNSSSTFPQKTIKRQINQHRPPNITALFWCHMETIPPEININNRNNGATGRNQPLERWRRKSLGRPISFTAGIDFLLSNPTQKADGRSRNSDSVLVQVICTMCESRGFFKKNSKMKRNCKTINIKKTTFYFYLPMHTGWWEVLSKQICMYINRCIHMQINTFQSLWRESLWRWYYLLFDWVNTILGVLKRQGQSI